MALLNRFPIGFWNNGDNLLEADPVERVNEWVELGFTWAMTPGFDGNDPQRRQQVSRLLDLAHQRGIKMLVFDRRAEAPGSPWTEPTRSLPLAPNYQIAAAAAVRDWAGHPAAWGLYICDEPLIGNLPAVAEACRFVRSLNSGLHRLRAAVRWRSRRNREAPNLTNGPGPQLKRRERRAPARLRKP